MKNLGVAEPVCRFLLRDFQNHIQAAGRNRVVFDAHKQGLGDGEKQVPQVVFLNIGKFGNPVTGTKPDLV